jgi:nitroreductase
MNDTLKALTARKSMRAFEPREIPEAAEQAILSAAFQAPTAGNQMLYTIMTLTDPALKATLADLCDHQPFIAPAPFVRIVLADQRRWLDTYRAAGLTPRPVGYGDMLLAMADAVIAAQNAVVAAESLGIGSCYIGDVIEHCEDMRALLRLPEEVIPAAMLVMGYPTEQQLARRKPARFDARGIVFENAYQVMPPEAHEALWREREAKAGRGDVDFAAQVGAFWRRKYESEFSAEMNRSAKVYFGGLG